MILEIDTEKMLGEIEPVGETNEDNKRYENLPKYDLVTRDYIGALYRASTYKDSVRASEKKIGELAYKYLQYLKQEIEAYLQMLEEEV